MITLVTPTLNSAKFLETLIHSVQKDPLVEKHIIVDSYSTDNTVEIARSHNCLVLHCDPGNMYAAVNHGLALAKSQYISYINSDDVWVGYDENFYNGIDILYSDIDFIDRNGRFLHSFRSSKIKDLKGLFSRGLMPFPQAGTIFKTYVWKSLKGFTEKFHYSSDYDFFSRAFHSNFSFLYLNDQIGAMFRIHEEQLSQSYKVQMRQECKISLGRSFTTLSSLKEICCFKFRNIDNYLIRLLRNASFNRKNKFRTLG